MFRSLMMVILTWGMKQEVNSVELCLSIITCHVLKIANTTDAHISLRGPSTDTCFSLSHSCRRGKTNYFNWPNVLRLSTWNTLFTSSSDVAFDLKPTTADFLYPKSWVRIRSESTLGMTWVLFVPFFFFLANRSVGCSLPLWRSEYPRPWWGTLDADVSLHLLPPPQRRLSLTFEYIHFVVLRVFPWSQLIPDYYALSLVPEALKTPRSLLHMNEDHSVKDDEA